jgi:hypothetical protein
MAAAQEFADQLRTWLEQNHITVTMTERTVWYNDSKYQLPDHMVFHTPEDYAWFCLCYNCA